MISPDVSQYLGVFLDEGQEQLDLLERHLLEMEKTAPTQEALQVMFRAAHTLKGSSRTMGFMRIGDLTHEMENVLDDMRNDKLGISTECCNALLQCLDMLKEMMALVQVAGTDESFSMEPVKVLVARLEAVRTGTASESNATATERAPAEFSAETLELAKQTLANDNKVFNIEVTIDENCVMKSVRVLMVLAVIREQAQVLGTSPGEDVLDSDDFGPTFNVLVEYDLTAEKLYETVSGVSEISNVVIQEFTGETKATTAKAKKQEAKAAESTPKEATPSTASQPSSSTIRVAVGRLDSLLNLVGELVIDRSQISRIASLLEEKYGQTELVTQLNDATHRIARITAELQDQIMKTRLLPVDGVFQRMPRMVRDLSQKTEKEIDFIVSGGETELDRSLLDVLADPVIHLLRNSIDHGVEPPAERLAAGKNPTGTVTLSARHEENHIVIEITDDGRGIDPNKLKESAIKKGILSVAEADLLTDHDAIKLIFASGFSTAAQLSDISGRGVGMDIVKSNIEKIGGRIHVDSTVGQGTKFLVHLPLTLAIVRALLVECGTATYAIPLSSVVETLKLTSKDSNFTRETVGGKAVIVIRGETVPLANLLGVLDGVPNPSKPESIHSEDFVVVIGFADKKVGLCVERLAGEQEVVIKPLGKLLGDVHGISGASILGDGRVALIVDSARAVNH